MSGPIVRKYGFPNFEQIFGERKLEHGAEEAKPAQEEAAATTKPAEATEAAKKEKKA